MTSVHADFAECLRQVVASSLDGQPCDNCAAALEETSVSVSQRAEVLFMVDMRCAACSHARQGWVMRNEAVEAVISSVRARSPEEELSDEERQQLTESTAELIRFKKEWDKVEQLSDLWS